MLLRKCLLTGILASGLLAAGCADTSPADVGLDHDLSEDQGDSALSATAPVLAQKATGAKRPIVLVAGMMEDANSYAKLSKALKAEGYDVSLYVPPNMGMDDINDYAKQLGKTVNDVVRRTRAEKVDLVAHSEGGLTARRYVQTTEGAPVSALVSMGTPEQGTEVLDLKGGFMDLLVKGFQGASVAMQQMTVGSMFLVDLNEQNDPTPGDVRYLAIGTETDMVTQPVARSAIPGAEHVVVQKACPNRNVGHLGLLEDAWAREVIVSFLSGGRAVGNCRARPIGGSL